MEESKRINSRRNQIIEVAQKLFGKYSIEKVSVHEIAAELHLSKASIYYYFPDKEHLFKAVLEKEQTEFISRISEKLMKMNDPEKMLFEYVSMRLQYFSRLMNLSRLRLEVFANIKPVFRSAGKVFKEKEKEILIQIFTRGIRNKVWKINDPDSTALLFLDILRGLRMEAINDRHTIVLEDAEFERLLNRITAFTRIFSEGMKIK
jgi:AcrR family transcriptional regulator